MTKNTRGHLIFYITHVCQMNCENCFSFNNYALKGHSLWKDNQYHCEQWAKIFDPAIIFILGGEPMLNPTFLDWMHGLAKIWPRAEIRVNTNGEAFHLYPDLYDEILPYKGRVTFSISGHNEYDKPKQIHWIENFLKGQLTQTGVEKVFHTWVWNKVYTDVKDPSWPDVWTIDEYYALPQWIRDEIENIHDLDINDYYNYDEPILSDHTVYVDENNIRIGWANWDMFGTSAIKHDKESNKMTLHNSDPEKAVSICHGGKCGTIHDGKFYKCAESHNLPMMLDQGFPIEVSEEDERLIRSYEPAEYTWDREKIDNFVDSLFPHSPIPQCKFCPEQQTFQKIHATNKKYKLIKKVS
jgi:organic radical activating enzyme